MKRGSTMAKMATAFLSAGALLLGINASSAAVLDGLDVEINGSGTSPAVPRVLFLSNEAYKPGASLFYEPFVFIGNTLCTDANCGQRNMFVIKHGTTAGRASQFYGAAEIVEIARSGSGSYYAENPYMLVCASGSTGECAGATGVNAAGEAVASEMDMDVRIPVITRKIALQLVSVSTDIGVSSGTLDAALIIANQPLGVGFRNGVMFGQVEAGLFGVYGSYLYAPNSAAPTNYINFPNMLVTGAGAMTMASDITATAGNYRAGTGQNYGWSGRSLMWSPADGIVTLTNNANNAFTRLQFGGASSGFPAIKRSGNAITLRQADDTIPTVASLTACATGLDGSLATVSDADSITTGDVLAHTAGTHHVLAYCNGTSWLVVTGT